MYTVNEIDGPAVAFVRTESAGVVKLYSGDTVPADADPSHVAALVSAGVLSEVVPAEPDEKPKGRAKP